MKKFIWLVVVLAIAGAGGWYYYSSRPSKEPTITTLKTSRGSIVDAVGATGTLTAVTTVTVGTQVGGIVQSLEGVDFNSIVKKGQVIARLDPSILETHVVTASANLTNAQANLERQRVAVADAQSKLARARELSARQLINKVDLENAETTVKSAEAQLKSTQSSIVQAQAAVNKARVDLNHTVITAPIDGIIIKRSVDRGQTVNAGMSAPELFIIAADLTQMQVNASIDETDVGRMRPGQVVTFRVDAYPTETFRGSVRQVRLNPVTVQNVVTYSTVIDVPNPELKLKPGMTANVSVEIARRDNVLRIPNAAIRFRPTKDIFDALNQAMPPELERGRGGRGTRGGNQNAAAGQPGAPGSASAAPATAPAPAANQPASGAPAASRPAGTATTGQVGARAQVAPRGGGERAADASTRSGQGGGQGRTGERNRQQGAENGGGGNPQVGGREAGGGQGRGGEGGRGGGFGNMTPEERQKRMEERMASMTPEERAAFQERMRQRQAQGGGPGGPGGPGGGNAGGRGGQGSGNAGNFQRGGAGGPGDRRLGEGRGNPGNVQRGDQGGQQQARPAAPSTNQAATTSATTIDALFAPLQTIETRGRTWLYVDKQLKPVELRLGVTDGTFTEVLNESDLAADTDVVTAIITAEMAARPAGANNPNANNPLMPQRGRGPGGPGGPGGGGRGGGRG